MDKSLVQKRFVSETKAADEGRTLIVKISTINPDRSRDVVMPKGVKLDNYKRNPVVLPSHDYRSLAIAKATDIEVTDDAIVAKVVFPDKGVHPLSDTYYEMYKGGFQSAWSIGFIPLKASDLEGGGRQFDEWELLEFSAVSVPDNPEALTILRSKGIDTTELENIVKGVNKDEDKKEEDKPVEGDEDKKTPDGEGEGEKSVEKEGRVLSKENRDLVETVAAQLKGLATSLEELLNATTTPIQTDDQKVVGTVEALKLADSIIGKALRDYKRGN